MDAKELIEARINNDTGEDFSGLSEADPALKGVIKKLNSANKSLMQMSKDFAGLETVANAKKAGSAYKKVMKGIESLQNPVEALLAVMEKG